MPNQCERIKEIKYHINQLLSELRTIEPNNSYLENFQPFHITLDSSLTTISNEKKFLQDNQYQHLSRKQDVLHSTTYHDKKKSYKQKKFLTSSPKKTFFTTSTYATSTPKKSSNRNILIKPHRTSTPRHKRRQSTDIIPLKRLLYSNNNDNKFSHRKRHTVKRSIILPFHSHLHKIDEDLQWI